METATLMDDADVEAWWAPDADATVRLVAAIAIACAAVPALNARHDPERGRFEPLPTIDLGIVIETESGVAVPVLHDIAHAPVTEIRRRLNLLKTVIEDSLPRPAVTLVNFGRGPCRYASLPVVPPQVAIVACGRAERQAGRHVLPLSLIYDARACGLRAAVRFLGVLRTDLARHDLPLARGWHI